MAVTLNLTEDDIRGRRIDLLGIAKVKMGVAFINQVTTIFPIGGIYYPSSLNKIVVSHVAFATASGITPPTGTFNVQLGLAGASDWTNGVLDFGTIFGAPSGVITAFSDFTNQQTPVYSRGSTFTVKNQSGSPSTDTMTISAYGWAE